MHSCVFEIQTTPIDPECRATAEELPEWFTGDVADYVMDSENRKEDIEGLLSCLGDAASFDAEASCLTLLPNAKRIYFEQSFKRFKELLGNLSDLDLAAYSGEVHDPMKPSVSILMYLLESEVSDRFGIYLYAGDELVPLKDWIRQAEIGQAYYIGGTMDYHC